MDHHLIELVNTLPDRWCLHLRSFTGKWLLKRSLARLVPREVIYRAKRGFDLPVGDWLLGEPMWRCSQHDVATHQRRKRCDRGFGHST